MNLKQTSVVTTFESRDGGPSTAAGCLSTVDWCGSEDNPWETVGAAWNSVKYFEDELTTSGPFLSVLMRCAPERPPAALGSSAFMALRAAYADDWPPEDKTRIGGGGDTTSVEHEESMPATVSGCCLNLGLSSSPFGGCTAQPPSALAVAPTAASSSSKNNSWVVAGR